MKGFSLLGAVITVGITGVLALAIPVMVGENQSLRTTQLQNGQAYYSARGALEFAQRQTRVDGNPITLPTRYFKGYVWSFTRAINTVQIATSFGDANNTFSMTDPNPVESGLIVDISAANISSKKLLGITLQKSGSVSGSLTITQMTVSWVGDASNQMNRIDIAGNNHYNSSGVNSGTTVTLSPAYTLSDNSVYPLTYIQWKSNISATSITVIFTLSNSTTKTVTMGF